MVLLEETGICLPRVLAWVAIDVGDSLVSIVRLLELSK
jgi:hypothetical protein